MSHTCFLAGACDWFKRSSATVQLTRHPEERAVNGHLGTIRSPCSTTGRVAASHRLNEPLILRVFPTMPRLDSLNDVGGTRILVAHCHFSFGTYLHVSCVPFPDDHKYLFRIPLWQPDNVLQQWSTITQSLSFQHYDLGELSHT